MNKRWIIKLFALTVLLPHSLARAENVDLDKIIVTSSRSERPLDSTARKVDLITASDIETSGAKDLAEALELIPSISVSSYGSLGATKTVRMRGSTSSQVLILIDERPLNSPRDGIFNLSTIPISNIERIEVLRGPGSSLYGSAAMGGTIHIITKRPSKVEPWTQIKTTYGTFRTSDTQISNGRRWENWGYLVTGDFQSSQGFRDNSDFSAVNFTTKLEWAPSEKNEFLFSADSYGSRLGTPGTITSPDRDDYQRTRKRNFYLRWRFTPGPETKLSLNVYNDYEKLLFKEGSAGSMFDTAFSTMSHETRVQGATIRLEQQMNDQYSLVGGFDFSLNRNESSQTAKHQYSVQAWYLENIFTLTEKTGFELGARLDRYSNFGTQASPSLGATHKFNERLKLHGVIGRSFRAPDFNDLYWPDEGWAKGNPNLKPEKGTTGEIGIETRWNKNITTDITYFHSVYQDLINWAENAGVWSPTNISSATIDGIEWDAAWRATDTIDLKLNYAYLRALEKKTRKDLIYQPRHKIGACAIWKSDNDLTLKISAEFTNSRFHNSANTTKVKNYLVLGADLSKKFPCGITYYFSIDNALNKSYQVIKDYPQAGLSVQSGLKFEF